jgi:hypothetical protein
VSVDSHGDPERDRGHRPGVEAFRAQRETLLGRYGVVISRAPRR